MRISSRRTRDYKIPSEGIEAIETLKIGGIDQTILIQGHSKNNPILLFLHGGPSMPIPGVSCRGVNYALVTCTKELVKHSTVVYWDQRGTGKSYSNKIPSESLHVEQYIEDALEITKYLKDAFGKERIHLAAHSWGTILGLKLISGYSEHYASYTAFSQIVNWTENDKLCYQWLLEEAERNNDKKMRRALLAVGQPPYYSGLKQWGVLRKWLMRNQSMFHYTEDGQSPRMSSILKTMICSPDYSIGDV